VNEIVETASLDQGPHFRDATYMKGFVKILLRGKVCDDFGIDPDGRSIFPRGSPGGVVSFSEDDTKKVNRRTAFALVAGCFVYKTLGEIHRTEFCAILEAPLASDNWRSTDCIVHNGAN
jgi:hypothetical protein